MEKTETKKKVDVKDEIEDEKDLILHNDEKTAFDEVVGAVMYICEFDKEKATILTLTAHFTGTAPLVSGPKDKLTKMLKLFATAGITTTID